MLRQASLILLAVTLFALSLPLQLRGQGQGVYGAIAGDVTDATKASVVNARVTATNNATGVQTVVSSNEAGYYTVANLIAGTYSLQVQTTGFNTFKQENIVVEIGSTVRLDVTLVVGNVQQQITVNGAPPALQTEKVEVAGTITSVELESIPTAYNNATGFVKLLPGVLEPPGENGLPSSSGDGYFGVNVNGGRAQQNLQRLDGVVDTEFVGGASDVVPPLDALESVTGDVANYDVEFGNAEGVVTSFTTKSGTNQWHGSGYEFNQVNKTSARNPFTEPVSTGHFVWNQFGGTIGGPIKKNKLFVFGGYQGVRIRSGAPQLTSVPTAAFAQGDFSEVADTYPIYDPNTGNPDGSGRTQFSYLGKANVIPPNRISSISSTLLSEIPLPNQPGDNNNFIAPLGSYTSDNNAYGRVDYTLNNNNRLFGRYTHNWQTSGCSNVAPFAAAGASGAALKAPPLALTYCQLDVGSEDFISADFVHVFSPTFVVEGRFGDMIYRWYSNELDQSSSTSTALGLPGLNDACSACGGIAGFRIGGPIGAFDFGNTDHAHQINNEGNYEYVGIGTWTKGEHTIKFGGDLDFGNDHRFDSSSQGNFGCHNGSLCASNGFNQSLTGATEVNNSGLSQASFLLGDASTFQRIVYAVPLPGANQKRDAFFAQDTYHVTPKLTAVLGLRWDYMGYPTSPIKGDISNFNYVNTDAIISNYGNVGPTAGVNNNWKDFAPRVGFAYRITPTTVIRAGYAKSFSVGFYGANFGAITDDWPTANRQELQALVNAYTPTITLGTAPPALRGDTHGTQQPAHRPRGARRAPAPRKPRSRHARGACARAAQFRPARRDRHPLAQAGGQALGSAVQTASPPSRGKAASRRNRRALNPLSLARHLPGWQHRLLTEMQLKRHCALR